MSELSRSGKLQRRSTPRWRWPARRRVPVGIVLALLTVYLIWGSTYLGIRIAFEELSAVSAGRGALSARRVGAVSRAARARHTGPNRPQWAGGALLGTLSAGGRQRRRDLRRAVGHVGSGGAWRRDGAALGGALRRAAGALAPPARVGRVGAGVRRDRAAEPGRRYARQPAGRADFAAGRDELGVRHRLEPAAVAPRGADGERRRDAGRRRGAAAYRLAHRRANVRPAEYAAVARVRLPGDFGALVAFSAYNYLLRRVRPALATSYA